MEPRGFEPRPAKVGHQPEASLAWTSVTAAAKRRRRTRRLCNRAPKYQTLWVPTHRVAAEGNTETPTSRALRPMTRRPGPTGVRDHGMPWRVPQEPERSRRLRVECRGTAERVRMSAAGVSGSRSAAVGARTRGNRPEGPRRAKGGAGSWTRWRERCRRHRASSPSQRNSNG
jgi:hypothetical protein